MYAGSCGGLLCHMNVLHSSWDIHFDSLGGCLNSRSLRDFLKDTLELMASMRSAGVSVPIYK